MGYRTPNIDRLAKEGALFTDFYAQQSCTAGRASFILGQHPFRTGLLTIGMPGSPQGIPDWSPTIADLLKAQGYVDRPVRQEPSGRPRQASADGAWIRRVPRQPLPPQRGGGARDVLLPEGSRIQEEVRSARRAAHVERRQGRAEDRRHRRADAQAHGNGRSGDPRRSEGFHQPLGQGRQAVLRLVQHHPHARVDPPEQGGPRRDGHRPLPGRHGRARQDGGRTAETARRPRHRRQHHRHLWHRQRRRDGDVAGRRHYAVPRGEGHDLGGWLPGAVPGALARSDQAGHASSTTSCPRKTGCPRCLPRQASPTSSGS